jgi:hypothetical protein
MAMARDGGVDGELVLMLGICVVVLAGHCVVVLAGH